MLVALFVAAVLTVTEVFANVLAPTLVSVHLTAASVFNDRTHDS
jgi:hypothetical protein